VIDYSFDPCLLTSGGDGDAISFPTGGGAANNYFNDGCDPPVTILPIELLSFTATPAGNKTELQWTTASELNNSMFTVERTTDGSEFKEIAKVEGAGTSSSLRSYSATDHSPVPGINYYRLKQTDHDGASTWSNIVSARINESADGPVWISAASGQDVDVQLSGSASSATVELVDMTGRIVYGYTISPENSYIRINIQSLPAGVYILRATNGTQTLTRKIVRH
jgi:hypothetical protein